MPAAERAATNTYFAADESAGVISCSPWDQRARPDEYSSGTSTNEIARAPVPELEYERKLGHCLEHGFTGEHPHVRLLSRPRTADENPDRRLRDP